MAQRARARTLHILDNGLWDLQVLMRLETRKQMLKGI